MPTVFNNPGELKRAVGRHLGYSDWIEVTQERIDKFAEATGDRHWVHVDPVRAKSGPYGVCIAHGFLTVSLIGMFLPQILEVRGIRTGVNYGADRLRFPEPVRVGARLRCGGELIKARDVKDGVEIVIRLTIEVEGSARPACVVDKLSRYYPA
ncbi:MAG: MaoC family dehydratase [Candidatus Binatia bacterium]